MLLNTNGLSPLEQYTNGLTSFGLCTNGLSLHSLSTDGLSSHHTFSTDCLPENELKSKRLLKEIASI